MTPRPDTLLSTIQSPADLRGLDETQLTLLASEIREFVVETVNGHGSGHLGSNLGAVEITLALHRVFRSPHDVILWDTGHQAYVHKLLTGRRDDFTTMRKEGGLSGYPCRAESDHDWIENSHASTIVSYAHGLATALHLRGEDDRQIVGVLGDGALTGGASAPPAPTGASRPGSNASSPSCRWATTSRRASTARRRPSGRSSSPWPSSSSWASSTSAPTTPTTSPPSRRPSRTPARTTGPWSCTA